MRIAVCGGTGTIGRRPARALLPGKRAQIEGPTFQEWLTSDDAAALAA